MFRVPNDPNSRRVHIVQPNPPTLWHGTSTVKDSLVALAEVLEANISLHDGIGSHNATGCISCSRGPWWPWLCSSAFLAKRLDTVQQSRARDKERACSQLQFLATGRRMLMLGGGSTRACHCITSMRSAALLAFASQGLVRARLSVHPSFPSSRLCSLLLVVVRRSKDGLPDSPSEPSV